MPLKKSDIEKLKKRLEEIREEMTKMVEETSKEVKSEPETKGYSQHQADEGTDDFTRSIDLQLTDKEIKILQQIDRAFEKIEEGTYGINSAQGPIKQ